jgi:predicted esterase
MTARIGGFIVAVALSLGGLPVAHSTDEPAGSGPFSGEWRTTIGNVRLDQKDGDVTGSYGDSGQFKIKGTVAGKVLTFEFQEGNAKGDGRYTLDDSGNNFTGSFQVRGGRAGMWNGWRPDPQAPNGQTAQIAGLWLSDSGLMELNQAGTKITGRYAARGTSEISGTLTGRRFNFTFKNFRPGEGWFDVDGKGKSLAGAAHTMGFANWFGWRGRQAPEFTQHAKLVAGKAVDGATRNLLTYCARAPEGFVAGAPKKWPTVLILHGSNMNARSYVETIAAAWPDVARDFLILGINGEFPSRIKDDPRFNYTYVNFMGKSTYKGFPGTDRESPALVNEAMAELKSVYPIDHYLVGGHSQGGFLTYVLLMHFPESVAGVFPVSAALIMQCEPNVFDDERLRAVQRAVPLIIVHGKNDPAVSFDAGDYAAGAFREAGWPAFRFLTDDNAGHMFARLPVGPAIRWLESLASSDPSTLLDFAEARRKEGAPRDAIAALRKIRGLDLSAAQKARADAMRSSLNAAAAKGASAILPRIKENKDAAWLEDFLAFRDKYEFADAAQDVMAAFNALRAKHAEPAQAANNGANQLFQQGKTAEAYKKLQEIFERYYASPLYRIAKRSLANRR